MCNFLDEKKYTEIWFKPFAKLSEEHIRDEIVGIESLIVNGKFEESIQKSKLLIDLCLEGLRYYQTYSFE